MPRCDPEHSGSTLGLDLLHIFPHQSNLSANESLSCRKLQCPAYKVDAYCQQSVGKIKKRKENMLTSQKRFYCYSITSECKKSGTNTYFSESLFFCQDDPE